MGGVGVERRITLRLLAYWEKLRAGRTMPAEEDIDPAEIEDLWPHCFMVRVADLAQPDYTYTYLGQAIRDAYSAGEGLQESGLVSLDIHELALGLHQVIETGKPVIDEGEFRNLRNDLVKYRQCLLPLGADGRVMAVFGGMRCKIWPS